MNGRRQLQRRYALIFSALVGGALLGSGLIELFAVFDDSQMAVARVEQSEATGASARIEQFFQALDAQLVTASPALWAAGGGTLDQRVNEYERLLRESPALTDILYINSDGRERLHVSRMNLNLIGRGVDHAQDPLFESARAQPSSMVYGHLFFGTGSEPFVTMARAEPGPNGGVLMADINLTFLRDVVSGIRIGTSGRAYVVDDGGSLVAHPDFSLVLRQTDLSRLPQVQAALAGEASTTIGLDPAGRRVLSAYHVIRPLNWVVVTEQPLAEAFTPVVWSLTRLLVVLAVGLSAALLASVLVSRRMVRPIHAMQVEAARHDEELRIAREIQQALLPQTIPPIPGWAIRTHYQPARLVGGDLYDVLPLPDGRVGLVVGDVAGEGVPAALLMATTRTVLRSTIAQGVYSPGEVLARANVLLHPDMPHNLFVTCMYAVLDPATGRLRFANAGHVAPLWRRGGAHTMDQLRARGMPLGLMPSSTYEEREVDLTFGETVLFYSDGVVEAHDRAHRMFDSARLASIASEGTGDGELLIQRVLAELAKFTGPRWEQEDDLTLVTLERLTEKEVVACHNNPPSRSATFIQVPAPASSTSAAI
jgi:serine phosphatase RsbU (regulator of sigma subunit)